MTTSDVAATLEYLVPGFIAIKIFSFFGFRSIRTDLELTLWSLAASVVLGWAGSWIVPTYPSAAALLVGVAIAGLAACAWSDKNLKILEPLRVSTAPRARDAILQKAWVQVALTNGDVLSGRLRMAAESTSDEQDIYIDRPAWIIRGKPEEMPNTAGVLIPGASVAYLQMLGEASN